MSAQWRVVYSKQAQKDAKKLAASNLKEKAEKLIELLKHDPLANPPAVKRLSGELAGCYSRRINIQHRLVYEVYQDRHEVYVLRMWSHYE